MKRITVARGDGIGPEIMDATLEIFRAAQVPLEYDFIEVGEAIYQKGVSSGIPEDAWKTIHSNKVILKAPITTPQGKGYKSLNVTLRKALGLFANVRPCKAYAPFVATHHPNMNLVIVRENEEDLYSGIEYQLTPETFESLKFITRPGTEAIIRFAFEYARVYGHKKVTCMTKDNIMKKADGLFHQIFDQVAREYPQITSEHMIIDIGAAKIAAQPEQFDVIVTLNLYGDIISDIAALVAGSVGLAGSSNVGRDYAMFEAIHGSAPDIAGKGIANPSGLLNAACQMLIHVGLPEHASLITNAWLKAIEDGFHTGDIYQEGLSKKRCNTAEFTQAIIERLGQKPSKLSGAQPTKASRIKIPAYHCNEKQGDLVGVDVFVEHKTQNPSELGMTLEGICQKQLKLELISNRGLKVYPGDALSTHCIDQWRCRFLSSQSTQLSQSDVLQLLHLIDQKGLRINKIENLYLFNGQPGYTLPQGH